MGVFTRIKETRLGTQFLHKLQRIQGFLGKEEVKAFTACVRSIL
jgi:hypothetical protein